MHNDFPQILTCLNWVGLSYELGRIHGSPKNSDIEFGPWYQKRLQTPHFGQSNQNFRTKRAIIAWQGKQISYLLITISIISIIIVVKILIIILITKAITIYKLG